MGKLLELSYNDLFDKIDWDFIHMQDHYNAIQNLGVSFDGMEFDILKFSTPSESRPGLRHNQVVQLEELRDVIDDPRFVKAFDIAHAAIGGDLKVHCDCEAFLMWGYQWLLIQQGAAFRNDAHTVPEGRYEGDIVTDHPPGKRNKMRRGSVCKHLANVIKVLPFWGSNIAGYIKRMGYVPEPATVQVPDQAQQATQPAARRRQPKRGQAQKQQQQPTAQQAQQPQAKRQAQAQQQADPWGIRKRLIKNLLYPESRKKIGFHDLVETLLGDASETG